jgi:glycopeptide antibiotics resistance protein
MTLTTLAWLALAAYGFHIMEEFTFDWRNWARAAIGLPVEWSDFYVTNAIVIALLIVQAELAATLPWTTLIAASEMLINAVFFHVLQVIRLKGRFSPGTITAVVLFIPLGIAVWKRAYEDGSLDTATVLIGAIGGAVVMAYPIVMLNVRDKPYFRQA